MDGSEVEVKRGRKYAQVVAGARDVFLSEGFEGASVDLIARRAGVSKATLYSYFSDKRMLFLEVAKQECAVQSDRVMEMEGADLPVREMLLGMGFKMTSFLTSKFAHRIFKICVAESDRFPELGRDFYRSGPQLMHDRLAAYLEHARMRGELEIDDVSLAAHQFQELLKADVFVKMVFNVIDTPEPDQLERVVTSAVDMFVAKYRPNDRGAP